MILTQNKHRLTPRYRARCLKGGCWESTFAVLTQLEGIGVAVSAVGILSVSTG
jgi:hypothetical protein